MNLKIASSLNTYHLLMSLKYAMFVYDSVSLPTCLRLGGVPTSLCLGMCVCGCLLVCGWWCLECLYVCVCDVCFSLSVVSVYLLCVFLTMPDGLYMGVSATLHFCVFLLQVEMIIRWGGKTETLSGSVRSLDLVPSRRRGKRRRRSSKRKKETRQEGSERALNERERGMDIYIYIDRYKDI